MQGKALHSELGKPNQKGEDNMRFNYDLAQAYPVLRDLLVYDATASGLIAGQAVSSTAINASEGCGGVIDPTTNTLVDIVGVFAETPPTTVSVMAAGTDYYAKVIINPNAVFLAQWSEATSTTNTVADSTGETVSATAIDANQEAGWVYVNGPTTDTGYGNLFKIGAQTSTTTLTNVTGAAYDDELKANTTSSTYIIIRRPLVNAPTLGGQDLDSTFAKLDGSKDSSGAAIVLENYINHTRFPMEPLRVARHGGKNVTGATFYGDVWFCDHTLRGAATLP